MKNTLYKLFVMTFPLWLSAAALCLPATARGQQKETKNEAEILASGGAFTLEKAVTAGGGTGKQSASHSENGTTGQTVAGVRSTGANFSLYSGFWTPDDFTPTSATAVVGGRILTASGAGIRNVQITITFPTGEIRTTVSTTMGYYRFPEIPVGSTYVISVAAKKYSFSQPSQIRQVTDDVGDVDFIADAQQ